MKMQPIFSDNFLSHHLSDFKLSNIPNNKSIALKIRVLVEELKSEKFESLKEEEIKSRFVTTFFGDILGFSYENVDKWFLREETKTETSGKKADASLGYFNQVKGKDVVRAVIEIKDAKTSLDEKQNRNGNNQTPVDQAFGYAQDMKGNCKWVIVSNIKEIRFYPSLDKSKCQVFLLNELIEENKLKELIFLFHKDKFINKNGQSPTDKLFEHAETIFPEDDLPNHIIDKIYYSLKRFEGFGFIDPNYLATISPFNILPDHVWHYENRSLLTLNSEIYDLLKGISVENGEISFTKQLELEISNLIVVEAKDKIKWIFEFLNYCLIEEIKAIKDYKIFARKEAGLLGFSIRHHFDFEEEKQGVTKNIWVLKNKNCDCLSCNYRSLDFNKLLTKLKESEGNEDFNNAEYAFGHYLVATNNYKTSYTSYKKIEREVKGKQGKGVEYFLTNLNLKYLQNLILDYPHKDRFEIRNDIKSVDLDKIIHDEIEFDIDKDVRKYLIELKQDTLIYKLQDQIDETISEIDSLVILFRNGGEYSGPNYPHNLFQKYFLLYTHINRNYIIYDTFTKYKSLTEKVFKGLLMSYQIREFGFNYFDDFILTEAILHISPDKLQKALKEFNRLEVNESGIGSLLNMFGNFTKSFFKIGIFSDPYPNTLVNEQICNYRFEYKLRHIFDNILTILGKLDISKEQFNVSKQALLNFLKAESFLAWPELRTLSNFILKKGNLFEDKDLVEILNIAISGDRNGFNKYNELIEYLPQALVKFYPECKIENEVLIEKAINNCRSEDSQNANFMHIIQLCNVCNDECQQILYGAFEKYLDNKFNPTFYEAILRDSKYDYNRKNYFKLYVEEKFKYKNSGYTFINFICILRIRDIVLDQSELEILINMNDFESWLLNPIDFDYTKFDVKWLIEIYKTVILDGIIGNKQIDNAIELELRKEYEPLLAELKYKYFNQ